MDLTCQHKNQTLLVEGPEIRVHPVGTDHRRLITRLILRQREAPDGDLVNCSTHTRSHHNRLSGREVNVISTAVVLDS
jgi:hypothetical protein